MQIVTVIAVDADHRCLTQRFRKIIKEFEKVLFEFLHLLESFLFQVVERSLTCSSTPCGCDTTAIPFRINTRPVCLVTDVDALRDLLRLSFEGLGGCLTVLVLGLDCVGNS